MKAIISFKIPEFRSFATKEINFKKNDNKESTFRNILESLNKNLDKNWDSIQFEFEDENILVCRHWLIETDFDFEQSHEIL